MACMHKQADHMLVKMNADFSACHASTVEQLDLLSICRYHPFGCKERKCRPARILSCSDSSGCMFLLFSSGMLRS